MSSGEQRRRGRRASRGSSSNSPLRIIATETTNVNAARRHVDGGREPGRPRPAPARRVRSGAHCDPDGSAPFRRAYRPAGWIARPPAGGRPGSPPRGVAGAGPDLAWRPCPPRGGRDARSPLTAPGRLAAPGRPRRSAAAGGWSLAWVVVLAATVALAPRARRRVRRRLLHPRLGVEAAAADLIDERFPGSSAESVDVVWQAPTGRWRPAVRGPRRPLPRAGARRSRASPTPARRGCRATAPSPSCDLALDRPSLGRPARHRRAPDRRSPGEAGGDGVRIELGGGPIMEAEGGGQPELVGLVAAAVILLVAFGSAGGRRPAARGRAVRARPLDRR